MIVTGGFFYGFSSRVSEYSELGFIRYLPGLLQDRWDHGCSYFENEEGTKVDIESNYSGVIIFQTFLVTGGRDEDEHVLSSTELLVENSAKWIYSSALPRPRSGLRGVNIDQRVIMTGTN